MSVSRRHWWPGLILLTVALAFGAVFGTARARGPSVGGLAVPDEMALPALDRMVAKLAAAARAEMR